MQDAVNSVKQDFLLGGGVINFSVADSGIRGHYYICHKCFRVNGNVKADYVCGTAVAQVLKV